MLKNNYSNRQFNENRYNNENYLKIAVSYLIDRFQEPHEKKIASLGENILRKPVLVLNGEKCISVFLQIAGQELISETTDESMERRHKYYVIFLFFAVLRHQSAQNNHRSKNYIIYCDSHCYSVSWLFNQILKKSFRNLRQLSFRKILASLAGFFFIALF